MFNDRLKMKFYTAETQTIEVPTRDEIEEHYKWNLKDIYSSDEDWEKDFKIVEQTINGYVQFEGRITDSSENLLDCLKFDEKIGIKLERLYLYSMLAKDSDMRDTKYQGMDDRIKSVYSKVLTANSFIKPELLKADEAKLIGFINSNPDLKIYKQSFDDLLRFRNYTLEREQEELLAMASEVTQVPYNTYSLFTNADLKFPKVADEHGNEMEMSHSRFYAALYSKDRNYRERAFKSYLKPYMENVNSFSSLFNGNLKSNIFYSKARKFNSAREAALFKNNIPISVYDNLVEAVNKNFAPMHRWASLKKKLLKVDELHPYDVYVTLFDQKLEKKYSYEESKQIVIDSLKIQNKL